jgi:beta-glucosidase/6-phospho-beta-glucosidase/beta-galactosidase
VTFWTTLNEPNVFAKLGYLDGKTITMQLPPLFKKIKNDIFKF